MIFFTGCLLLLAGQTLLEAVGGVVGAGWSLELLMLLLMCDKSSSAEAYHFVHIATIFW
jgi:hypothetical protein